MHTKLIIIDDFEHNQPLYIMGDWLTKENISEVKDDPQLKDPRILWEKIIENFQSEDV